MGFTAGDIIANLMATCIGVMLTYATTRTRKHINERKLKQSFRDFFGPAGTFAIVHSVVFDQPEQAYNFPATDTHAARIISKLFESLDLKEGRDFFVYPDRRAESNPDIWDHNLILLCGPARNSICRRVTPMVRMQCAIRDEDGTNVLEDYRREPSRLFSSRELPSDSLSGNFDLGLIASLPNPHNLARKIVILAGIHGTGTVGAAEFVAKSEHLKELNRRREREIVSEIVRADYDTDIETPTRISLL